MATTCFTHFFTHNGRLFPVSSRYSVSQQFPVDPLPYCTSRSSLLLHIQSFSCLLTRYQHTSYFALRTAFQPLTLAHCFPLALGTVYRSSSPWIRCPIVSHVFSLLFPHSTTLSQRHPRPTLITDKTTMLQEPIHRRYTCSTTSTAKDNHAPHTYKPETIT